MPCHAFIITHCRCAEVALDPDTESRLRRAVVDREDREEEEVLLAYVWQFVRAGQTDKASIARLWQLR